MLATLLKKETPAQVFACKYCESFKNSFPYRTSLVAASGLTYLLMALEGDSKKAIEAVETCDLFYTKVLKILKRQYTVSEFHFRSVNYTVAAKIHKNFEQNKPFW